MLRSSSAIFDKLLEKATSHLLLEPDWSVNLAICDALRQGDVQAKYAVLATKKKLYHENPHVAVLALSVLEAMVKNCGSAVHDEVGQLPFMQELRELVVKAPDLVREKLLELLQTWAFAFRQTPKYRAVQDTVQVMRAEGYKFPTLRESDAMFSSESAPEWADGEVCHRCRDPFSTFNRKHHCRACGQVFCSKCSSKTSNIPKFGIEREVRVCDSCFDQINKPGGAGPSAKSKPAAPESELPPEYLASPLSKQSQAPPARKSEEELKEEEELALALAISQSEAEAKDREKARGGRPVGGSPAPHNSHSGGAALKSAMKRGEAGSDRDPESDPELARYLNRSYWEARQEEPRSPTAPAPAPSAAPVPAAESPREETRTATETYQNGGSEPELDQFVATICSQLEIFVNRMKSNSSRGRPIANDSSVQTLFMNVTAMHSQLLHNIQLQDDQRVHYEGLQDRLAQARDARAALDALREEHRERLRRQAEEAQRQRQLQMMQKLEIMRKKKQEYLQYQRQLALQRMQEQEREMARRQEQQYMWSGGAFQQPSAPWAAPLPAQPQTGYGAPPPEGYGAPAEGYGGPAGGYGPPQGPPGYTPYNLQSLGAALPGPPADYGVPPQGYPQGTEPGGLASEQPPPIPGQLPPQGIPGQLPGQGQPPPQGIPGQLPGPGQPPPQGIPGQPLGQGQPPPQGIPGQPLGQGQPPPQGIPGQLPPQGMPGQVPGQVQLPPQAMPGQVPGQGQVPPNQMAPPQGLSGQLGPQGQHPGPMGPPQGPHGQMGPPQAPPLGPPQEQMAPQQGQAPPAPDAPALISFD